MIIRVTGHTISIPLKDINISIPLVGQIVTFSFESHSRREVPVNPKIQRIRNDVTWEELINTHNNEKESENEATFNGILI